jgi:hypothetical protein
MIGLARSNDAGVEILIQQIWERAMSDDRLLQAAGAAVVDSETGISALRQFVLSLSQHDEKRALLECLLDIVKEAGTDHAGDNANHEI